MNVPISPESVPEVVDTTSRYRLEITPDEDAWHLSSDPRHELDEVRMFIVRSNIYSSFGNDMYGDDATLRAYLYAENELRYSLEDAVRFTQRFENIFGTGRTLEYVTIYGRTQGDWLVLLVVAPQGVDSTMNVKCFEANWGNDYYNALLTEITTTEYDDGSSDETEEILDACGGFLVLDSDWDYIIEEMCHGIDLDAVEVVEPF